MGVLFLLAGLAVIACATFFVIVKNNDGSPDCRPNPAANEFMVDSICTDANGETYYEQSR